MLVPGANLPEERRWNNQRVSEVFVREVDRKRYRGKIASRADAGLKASLTSAFRSIPSTLFPLVQDVCESLLQAAGKLSAGS